MTQKRPLSVIMPCYNEATVVGRAIESILNQSFSDFEFIIVDDGSTDGTFEICAAYANRDDRIHLFRLEENSGSCARPLNLAIEKSTAPVLARMDADDVSYPERFERQYAFLLAHPEVDVLGTAIRCIEKETDKPIRSFVFEQTHEDIIKNRYRKNFVAHPTVMLRKKVYTYFGGYDEQIFRGQDNDLWYKSYGTYTFHNLPEVLLDCYRIPAHKGLSDYSSFESALNVKYRAMRRNKELWSQWPNLFVHVAHYYYHQIKSLFLR